MASPCEMAIGERRSLTAGEAALGRSVFGDEIDWPRVAIVQAPRLGFAAMVPFGSAIVFANWRAPRDFAGASLQEQGWFAHELTHVWQAARGVILVLAKLRAVGRRAYLYRPDESAAWAAYNIEQQAEIVRHLFLARAQPEASDPWRVWRERLWLQRLSAGRDGR